MITAQVEKYGHILQELVDILPTHYEELALNKDKVPLEMNHNRYFEESEVGNLFVVTVRKDTILIGYYIGFLFNELHYMGCFSCATDIFYILPEERRSGAGGLLFAAVEKELKLLGVDRWFVSAKEHSKAGASALLEKLEFKPVETTYCKWIGG